MTHRQKSSEAVMLHNPSAIYPKTEAVHTYLYEHLKFSTQKDQTKLRPGIRRKRDTKAGEQL
jgi:hypothetical protein